MPGALPPVAWGTHNRGAWEAVLRLSYLDLVDGAVRGGRGVELMPGLNWYLSRRLRHQLEYGYTHVQDGPQDGNLHLVQLRVDVTLERFTNTHHEAHGETL